MKPEKEMTLDEKLAYYKELTVEERLTKLEKKLELLIPRVEVNEAGIKALFMRKP